MKISRNVRLFLLFLTIFLIYFLSNVLNSYSDIKNEHQMMFNIISSIFFSIMNISIYILIESSCNGNGNSKEKFWTPSKYSQCKGGPYMWQGDEESAKMCRELASTEEGRIGIASYNCPTGTVGQPKIPFYYTENIDRLKCNEFPKCKNEDTGICGTINYL